MRLRRVCLLILGFAISTGLCCVWLVLQQEPVPVVAGCVKMESLPMIVQGSDLLAEQLVSYEGEYIEDTEFGEFVFVTGLILRNTGDNGIVSAKVMLSGPTEILEFDATYIPPGKAVLVLEKNRKETVDIQFYSCTGTVDCDKNDWDVSGEISVNYLDNDVIEIRNTTGKTLTEIQLYYKTLYAQGLFYIGGITHCYRINTLSPEETVTVRPEYFVSGLSEIVYISTNHARS